MTTKRSANRFWGDAPVPKAKTEFFNAVTTPAPSGDGSVATIRMYGPIDSWGGYWGISTKDVGSILDALPESVTRIILRINSPGGEVFEGVSILNMLRAHRASVTAVVDGLAASAASVIAAGADDTVMSPGTQMMIHSPWSITLGNAKDLRKEADVLDGLEASIVEIYTAKAGQKDWATLLADDTWMTAAEAVEAGLANRVAVIPDAGETETVGETDDELILIPDDEIQDASAALVIRVNARAAAARPKPPSSSEPGNPNRKEDVVAYDDLKAGLRTRLGMTDADVTDEQVFAALDEVLEEQATTPTGTTPDGTVLMDAAALADLQAAAQEGRAARAEQDRTRRDGIVNAAIDDGRIAPASADTWRAALDRDEDGTVGILGTLAKGAVPVAPSGYTGGVDEATDEDRAYDSIFPKEAH
ncbi:head maturation protease, ClpP-related [Microbacterium sp. M1A1_1b]